MPHHLIARTLRRSSCVLALAPLAASALAADFDPYTVDYNPLVGNANMLSCDLDGDGKTDRGVFDPQTGVFSFVLSSTGGTVAIDASPLLLPDGPNYPVVGDFDGDGIADVGIYQPSAGEGTFTILLSSKHYSVEDALTTEMGFSTITYMPGCGFTNYPFDDQLYSQSDANAHDLQPGEYSVPVVADIEGTGIPDFIAFDPLTSLFNIIPNPYNHITGSQLVEVALQFGQGKFYGGRPVPVAGNFDGGNQMELAVYEPSTSTFSILKNAGSLFADGVGWTEEAYARQFGPATPRTAAQPIPDVPVIADYDGDGVADLGLFASPTATWIVQGSRPDAPLMTQQFGPPGQCVPLVGDYTGLGHADDAIFIPATATFAFFLTGGGANVRQFGPAPVSVPLCGAIAPARAMHPGPG
jgi:hypothetical protein